MRDGYRVIDVDTHVTPSLDVLLKYGDTQLNSRADELEQYKRVITPTPGRGHPTTEYTMLRINPKPYSRVAGTREEEEKPSGAGTKGALEGRVENIAEGMPRDGVQHENSDGRLLDMNEEGVDVNVLIPGPWAPGVSALDLSMTKLLYESYHRYMREYCSADSRRLKGLILAAGDDPEWSAKQIRSLADEDWVCAVWPALPEGLPVDDPSLEPIWQAMDEHDLPILHHSFFYESPYFPGYRDIWGNATVARTAAHVWGAQRLISYILISGMLDRYPTMRVATVETGHSWLPHWMIRLDSQVSYVKGGANPDLKHKPLEYLEMGKVFCAIEAHEGADLTRASMDVVGPDVFMYASDYPHPECDFPRSVDNVIAWTDTLGGEEPLRKLLSGNASRYLRLLSDPWESSKTGAGVAGQTA